MVKGGVTLSIGVLALAAMAPGFAPLRMTGFEAPERPAASAAAVHAEVLPSPAERESAGYREATIGADAQGQYATQTLVDGAPVPMLIDTGASVVALSASTATRLGLVPGPGPRWTIKTANGELLASPVTLELVSFGGLYMRDVQALILAPEAGDVNLLGASFLKRLVSVEQRDGVLFLRQ